MNWKPILTSAILAFLFLEPAVVGQTRGLAGYVYEENNRGFLNQVELELRLHSTGELVASTQTDSDGFFEFHPDTAALFSLTARKKVFLPGYLEIDARALPPGEKLYLEVELERKPGYLLEATLTEKMLPGMEQVDAITGSRIEIFNQTRDEEALALEDYPYPVFSFTLEQGNHYTIMIRKTGYLTKRIEAYVNVENCILCIDGVRDVGPGVAENLTEGHQVGTLLANIELDKARLDKILRVENIYYDYNKWEIRPDAAVELDKVVRLMKDNPGLIMELGSHTDSRGNARYNLDLSQKRAESAVDYIVSIGGVQPYRLEARGYGETALVNRCRDGVACSEEEHQENRRTELRIIGFDDLDTASRKSLAEIIREERYDRDLQDWEPEEFLQVRSLEDLPEDLRNEIIREVYGADSVGTSANRPGKFPEGFTGYTIELGREPDLSNWTGKPVFRYPFDAERPRWFTGTYRIRDQAVQALEGLHQDFPQVRVLQMIEGKPAGQ